MLLSQLSKYCEPHFFSSIIWGLYSLFYPFVLRTNCCIYVRHLSHNKYWINIYFFQRILNYSFKKTMNATHGLKKLFIVEYFVLHLFNISLRNQKNQGLCCLSPARPNRQRQGLNLYGHLIQTAHSLRRWWVWTLAHCLLFPFRPALFIREQRCR